MALAVSHGIDPAAEADIHAAIGREVGWRQASLAIVVDIAKGVFPVLLGFGFSLPVWAVSLAAAAAVTGQMWPPLKGHGNRGNSTGFGALVALVLVNEAYVGLWSLVFFGLSAMLLFFWKVMSPPDRYEPGDVLPLFVRAGTLLGFVTAPFVCWVSGVPEGVIFGLSLIACAIVVKRLTAGLRVDLSVGAPIGPLLLRRLVFDQALVGRN